jgi:hypothetical protein
MGACMVGQLGRCDTMMIGAFTFGSILCTFFLERVIMLRPQVILDSPSMHDPWLMRWVQFLNLHGGGEGGNYFTPTFEGVWRHTS